MPEPLSPVLPVSLPRHAIDEDAYKVCRRLQEAGFVTYLVGGCVRDIILGRSPKDFDIGTLATPPQIRKLFRNCRLIGRRFRLAHIVFGPKILEVATFRGGTDPEDDDGTDPDDMLIRRANNFGTPQEDALSRDFTVNGLFYDPVAQRVIDHVQGYRDLRARVMRTIGEPEVRFREDPVRILRAIKFASRLGFDIHPETWDAMCAVSDDIARCSVPRLTEEVYRLAESRHAAEAFRLLDETGSLRVLLPELAEHVSEDRDGYLGFLRRLDRTGLAHDSLPREMVLSMLYLPLALREVRATDLTPGPAWGKVVDEWFRPVGVRMHIAVRHRARLRSIVSVLGRVHAGPGKRKPRLSTGERAALPQALTAMRLLHGVDGDYREHYERWRSLAAELDIPWVPVSEPASMRGQSDDDERGGRRRRRGRRRRS